LTLYVFKFNKSSLEWMTIDEVKLSQKLCTRDIVKNDQIFDQYGLQTFYCVDWSESNYPLGGSWDGGDMVYYFEKVFYTCPNDDKTSPNCTKFSFLKDWLGQANKLYYSIIYPQLYFSPGNYSKPLQISYVNYFYTLSSNLYKKNRYFMAENELQSDKGWIFNDFDRYNLISYDSHVTEVDYKSDTDLANPSISSSIYATTIYMMKDHNKYNLSYLKIQDVAAQVGGFMKILMVFCLIINYHYNLFRRDVDVINKLFEFDRGSSDKINPSLSRSFQRGSSNRLNDLLHRKTCKNCLK